MANIIRVAQPDMPPLEEFIPYLEEIWQRRWLTNDGCFLREFESGLSGYLDVEHVSVVSNGTLALLLAIQAMELGGEVITTPYSFVATSHTLLWNNIAPVFVDICPDTFSLDAERVEQAITPATSAILAVHCYGYPSDVDALQSVADRHGVKLIYDAAHAFGEHYRGNSLLAAGDISILSFHATKVFHTFEGGAVISRSAEMKRRIDFLRNFGFAGELEVVDKGINAKMNEIQAAYGLLQLKYVDAAIDRRARIDAGYRAGLAAVEGLLIPGLPPLDRYNYSYFPVLISGDRRDEVYHALKSRGIYCRRYFYPLISNLPMYRDTPSAAPDNLPVANRVADQVLCLPMHAELTDSDVERVVAVIIENLGERK